MVHEIIRGSVLVGRFLSMINDGILGSATVKMNLTQVHGEHLTLARSGSLKTTRLLIKEVQPLQPLLKAADFRALRYRV